MARSSQVRSAERCVGVSVTEVVMDDMAIGNLESPVGPAGAFGPRPRHPYSAVPFLSNWQLWRKFPYRNAISHNLVKFQPCLEGRCCRHRAISCRLCSPLGL